MAWIYPGHFILWLGYIQDILFYGLDISRTSYFMAWIYPGHFILWLGYILDISIWVIKHVADIFFFEQFCHKKKIHFLFSNLLELFSIREKFSCISGQEKCVLESGIR